MDKTKMLEGLIEHYTKGNKAQFAKLLGVSAQTISAWIARNTFDAELIYTKCRCVNPSWLLTGEGSMLQTTKQAEQTAPKQHIEIAHQVPEGSNEGIPLIPLDAVAGFPADGGSGVSMDNWERYVIPEFADKGANFLIRVSGCLATPWCRYIIVATSSPATKSPTSVSSNGAPFMSSKQVKAYSSNVCRKAKNMTTASYAFPKTTRCISRSSFRATTYAALAPSLVSSALSDTHAARNARTRHTAKHVAHADI